LREQLEAIRAELQGLEEGVKSGDAETVSKAATLLDEMDNLEKQIAEIDAKRASVLDAMSPKTPTNTNQKEKEMSKASFIAKAFVDAVKGADKSDMRNFKAAGVAVKAALTNTDPVTSMEVKDIDYSLTGNPNHTPLASVMGNYAINGNTYQWYVQEDFKGDFAVTAEAGEYPQMSDRYEPKTVVLQKLAGFIKETDEVLEDNDFLVSAVDDDLLYKLAIKEDNFIATKILADEGIQAPAALQLPKTATAYDIADAIYAAKALVSDKTPFTADCLLINPADMQVLALAKNENKDYVGGSYFTAGNHAAVWGVPVFETAQVAKGTILVGAFKQSVKVVKNRGIEVAVATQNEDDFIHGMVTLRANERLAVAVKAPEGLVKITIASA
jgi:HK97 family phage major capsid protein